MLASHCRHTQRPPVLQLMMTTLRVSGQQMANAHTRKCCRCRDLVPLASKASQQACRAHHCMHHSLSKNEHISQQCSQQSCTVDANSVHCLLGRLITRSGVCRAGQTSTVSSQVGVREACRWSASHPHVNQSSQSPRSSAQPIALSSQTFQVQFSSIQSQPLSNQ